MHDLVSARAPVQFPDRQRERAVAAGLLAYSPEQLAGSSERSFSH
jgi:hypothetical protein